MIDEITNFFNIMRVEEDLKLTQKEVITLFYKKKRIMV